MIKSFPFSIFLFQRSKSCHNLANLLTSLAGPGLDRAFFVSGGSEASESAIKLCRQYFLAKGEAQRWKVIGREPGYHGGTLGALALGFTFALEKGWLTIALALMSLGTAWVSWPVRYP